MTFQEFIKAWDGKPCEIAGAPQDQCVDLANQYIRDVLGEPIVEWTNAIDFPSRLLAPKWVFTQNNPNDNLMPEAGALMIWRPLPGHIGMYIRGDKNRFLSFDQNFPVGSKSHVQKHTWQNVIGWITYRSSNTLVAKSDCEKQKQEEIEKKNTLWKEKNEIKAELDNRKEQVSRLKQQLLVKDTVNSAYQSAMNDNSKKDKVIEELTKANKACQDAADKLGREKGEAINKLAKMSAEQELLQGTAQKSGFALIMQGIIQILVKREAKHGK